ncbi:hypothetical protein LTR17_024498 [Elasticomyces elasticus]|nr:hypothetical protein LTR17_024498 [Elasticomyces elasticus]
MSSLHSSQIESPRGNFDGGTGRGDGSIERVPETWDILKTARTILENCRPWFVPPAGEKTTGTAGSVFDAATGSIGKAFTTQGAIGGTAQKIGGPFDQSGMIGKQFTTEGSIGASAQNILAGSEKTSVQEK